jgi:hypothetical protein
VSRVLGVAESELTNLAQELNRIARSVMEADGEHVAMYFLGYTDGRPVESSTFEDETPDESVGAARGRQIAKAVESAGADAVVMVTEAWSVRPEKIPDGGRVRDAAEARDVLLVAGIDRSGVTIAFKTPVFRDANGVTLLGETGHGDSGYEVSTFDDVRAVWGLATA